MKMSMVSGQIHQIWNIKPRIQNEVRIKNCMILIKDEEIINDDTATVNNNNSHDFVSFKTPKL